MSILNDQEESHKSSVVESKQEHLTEQQPVVECGHSEGNKPTSPKKKDNVF